jgi:hypothetical protein
MTASNLASSKIDNPMAAMLLARNVRLLAAQGNIKTSNSGRIFSGQNSPATPNARQACTTRHNPRTLIFVIPTMNFLPIEPRLRSFRGDYEGTAKHFPHQAKIQRRQTFNPSNNFLSFNKLLSFRRFAQRPGGTCFSAAARPHSTPRLIPKSNPNGPRSAHHLTLRINRFQMTYRMRHID